MTCLGSRSVALTGEYVQLYQFLSASDTAHSHRNVGVILIVYEIEPAWISVDSPLKVQA